MISKDCLFCKMIAGEISVPKVYEDESFICIRDIRPQAKIHLLVIPKLHVSSLATAFPESQEGHAELVGKMFRVATEISRSEGLLPGGFRSVINTEENGGQTIFHLHLHILGGESLRDHFG